MRKLFEIGWYTYHYIWSKPRSWQQLAVQAVLGLWVLYAVLTMFGAFHKEPTPRIPDRYAFLQVTEEWQFQRHVDQHPRSIDEVVLFPGVDAAVVHFHGNEETPGRSNLVVLSSEADWRSAFTRKGIKVREEPAALSTNFADRTTGFGMTWLITLSVTTLVGGLLILVNLGGPASVVASTNQRKRTAPITNVTFNDVAGCDEAIEKLHMVVQWLKYPFWYSLWRAKVPKGVLMKGPPGTGKTLLARAVAGEAGIPQENFLTMSGSDFVEMFVGVGAKRVREKFDQAEVAHKANGKPVIMFIDEIDAVGKARSNGPVNNDERDQTLNQLLVGMDGFEARDWLIIIAATNRADMLDPALLRPGRFDYHVDVGLPDIVGREKILSIHTRGMDLAEDVNLRWLAEITPGFSGAQLFAICNEAAVIGANRTMPDTQGKTEEELRSMPRSLTRDDFVQAIDFVKFGDYLKSKQQNQSWETQYNTAVHEGGHGGIAHAQGIEVSSVSIQMRSKSLGLMQAYAKKDQYGYDEKELLARIRMALAGRIAQEVILNVRDSGATGDFQTVCSIARKMVCEMGMSELGPLYISTDERGWPLTPIGTDLQNDIDHAWRKIVKTCYDETKQMVEEHRERILRIAEALMARQTLVAEEFVRVWNGEDETPADEQQPGEVADTAGEVVDTAGEVADRAGEVADTAGEAAPLPEEAGTGTGTGIDREE